MAGQVNWPEKVIKWVGDTTTGTADFLTERVTGTGFDDSFDDAKKSIVKLVQRANDTIDIAAGELKHSPVASQEVISALKKRLMEAEVKVRILYEPGVATQESDLFALSQKHTNKLIMKEMPMSAGSHYLIVDFRDVWQEDSDAQGLPFRKAVTSRGAEGLASRYSVEFDRLWNEV